SWRGERDTGRGIGILPTGAGANRPEPGLKRAKGVPEAAGVDEPLADGRHDLLVLADQRAVGAEVDLGVEHSPEGVRNLLAYGDDDIRIGVARRRAERVGLAPRDFDRVLEQFGGQSIGDGAGRRMVVIPDRMCRNETLGKADHARAVAAGLANEAAGLLGRTLAIEEDRGGLHRGDLHHDTGITHDGPSTRARYSAASFA